ncbi:hypothetical protein SCLCIDRAFT_1216511 [Scleroderma citrinum Foug A]|uniref:Uncharacterized protein n=1 Tax=Scleroderma citrinum Foug A TaxID=1036808 RepID=A0A0C3A7G8_9AGAM|nr:hypothetical protein SCLCIDRAFT_1216511 [Scleroderma citrinum Foug A]
MNISSSPGRYIARYSRDHESPLADGIKLGGAGHRGRVIQADNLADGHRGQVRFADVVDGGGGGVDPAEGLRDLCRCSCSDEKSVPHPGDAHP